MAAKALGNPSPRDHNDLNFVAVCTHCYNMFAKPATFKPFAAIKNSERKNVLATIEAQNKLDGIDPDDKQKLVPKGIQSAKGVTHGGDKIVVYSDHQFPLWVVVKSTFVPTVGLMSTLPADLQVKLLPCVYTRALTWQYLKNGADFMIPGIFGDLPQEPVKVGSAVQIRDLEQNGLIAVGIALTDLSKINPDVDTGKCVQTISVAKDKLTPNVDVIALQGLSLNDTPAEPSKETKSEEAKPEPEARPQDNLKINIGTEDEAKTGGEEPMADLSTEEVDEAFMYALNRAIRQPQNEYPMPMSTISTIMNGYMPYEHPKLAIKNTSFKKMNKLLKFGEKRGLISTRERQGGEVLITGVNVPTDPDAVNNLEKPKQKAQPKAEKMQAITVYKPTPAIRQLLPEDQGDFVDVAYMRRALVAYIQANNLAGADHKTVTVDEPLRKALGLRQTVETVQIGEVGTLAAKKSSAFHRVTPLGKSDRDMPLEKGPIPTIEIKTERRGGNKVVSLVGTAGLRGFYIDPTSFADELRHACAGSSTITNVKGFEAIVVQGNHVQKIAKLLEKKGIKQSWVKF